jgi:hypothetical protein
MNEVCLTFVMGILGASRSYLGAKTFCSSGTNGLFIGSL